MATAACFNALSSPARGALRCALALGLLASSAPALALSFSSLPGSPAGLLARLGLVVGAGLLLVTHLRRVLRNSRDCARRLRELEHENAVLRQNLETSRANEESARLNAERFRSLASLSSDWYWEQDATLRFSMCTNLQPRSGGPGANFIIGRKPWELEGIERSPLWKEHLRVLEERRSFRGLEYKVKIGSETRWVSVNGEPVFDDSGRFRGYRGTARDITRRKRAELALRASEERFHEIIESMPVAVFIKDPESRMLLMNRECERQWGIALENVQGTTGAHFYSAEELQQYLQADRAAFEGRRLIESETTIRNFLTGEVLTLRALKKPVFDEHGNPRYLIGISVDITERKRAEEQLRESRELLRRLARHQARVKEEERKRIARDIHDELGQNLLALKLEVASIVNGPLSPDEAGGSRARLMMETVDRTIRSVRHIINDLRPAVLDLGLVPALEWQAREFTLRTGISCRVEVAEEDRDTVLEDMQATTLFRVLQESLTNVQRHAGATQVGIGFRAAASSVSLTVNDNGKGGVTLDSGREKQSFGLLGMRERLRLLGGVLEVSERRGGGTVLVASVPLASKP